MKKFIIFFYISCFATTAEELEQLFKKDELKALILARDMCKSEQKDNFHACFGLAYWFKFGGDEKTYEKYYKKFQIKVKEQCKIGNKQACEMDELE